MAQVGGFRGLLPGLARIDPGLARAIPADWVGLLSLVILTSLGTWGMPQMVQKFYAVNNEHVIHTATIVATLFALVIAGAAYLVGSTVHLYFSAVPVDAAGNPVYNTFIPQLLSRVLPEALLIIILLLVLSASLSTLPPWCWSPVGLRPSTSFKGSFIRAWIKSIP